MRRRKPNLVYKNCNTPKQNKIRKFFELAGHTNINIAFYPRQHKMKIKTKQLSGEYKYNIQYNDGDPYISLAYSTAIGEIEKNKVAEYAKRVLSIYKYNIEINNYTYCWHCKSLKSPEEFALKKFCCDICWPSWMEKVNS